MGIQDPINSLGEIAVDVLVCGPTTSRRCPPGTLLRTADRPPFLVVLDREDDVRFTRTPLAAHDVAAGRVVVHPTVTGNDRLLWHDVLDAVADDRHLHAPAPATRSTPQEQEHAVRAALKAEAVRQLTVLRAHRIDWGRWADLVNLHRTTQTDVVMVHHAIPSPDLTHLLRHCDHRVITTHAALRSLHPPAGAAPGN
ncbi:hypothetical protein ACFRAA_23150 [[Kitasatospora] papulosa]|uniref:hypothetical protein n=1 Tax=[Kitasatospora] papulosa TaxID=1464011 RepID=UPI0036278756